MAEQVAPGLLVRLHQQHGDERLVERGQELVLAEHDHALEQRRVDVTADHGGDTQELRGRRIEPSEPERDHLLDALGQPEPLELGGAGAPDLYSGLDQVPDHLLDEERVALGLLVQRPREPTRRALPRPHAHELGGLGLAESPDVELRGEPVPAKLPERARERVAAALGGAVCAEDQQSRRVRGPGEVAQQQQRRTVGPLEVVEHEQHRRRPRQLGQQPDDGLEQPVALGLGLVLRRRRKVGDAPAQLGDQPRELGPVLARPSPKVGELGVHRPMPERLEERLVGDHGLARRAAGEHDRARVVDPPRELGAQRRLADPGIAGEQHDPAALRLRTTVDGRDHRRARATTTAGPVPPRLEIRHLLRAPDQRPLRAVAQLRRQRDRRRSPTRIPARSAPIAVAPIAGPILRAKQSLVRGDRLGRRARAELVAEQRPQPVEHTQRLGDVATRGQRLHQQHIAGLAVRLGLDQGPGRPLGRLQLRAAHHQAGATDHLEGLLAHVLELAAGGLEPGRLRTREQAAAGDVERHLRQRPGAAPVAPLERVDRARNLGRGRLDVDPDRLGERQDQLVAPGERRGPERGAQSREQRPQRRVLRDRRLIGPQRIDQLIATDVPRAVEHEVREQQRDLPAAQPLGKLHAVDLHGQASTELDPSHLESELSLRQRSGNVSTTPRLHRARAVSTEVSSSDALGGARLEVSEDHVDHGLTTRIDGSHRRIAHCECGALLAGDNEHELFQAAQRHLAHHHPQLLGALGPGMVSQMAEDVGGQETFGAPGGMHLGAGGVQTTARPRVP